MPIPRDRVKGSLGKRLAAAAGLVCVGVGELEAPTNHGIAIVKHEAIEIQHTFRITNHLKPFVVIHLILGLDVARFFKIHGVRHP